MTKKHVFGRPVEKRGRRCYALLVTVVALQALLWASLFVAASTAYLFIQRAVDASLVVPEILLLASAGASLCYILLYSATARLRKYPLSGWTHRAVPTLRWLCNILIMLVVVSWLASCGVWITVIVVRQPFCLATVDEGDEVWMSGKICILQRSALAAGLLCLIASATLSVNLVLSHEPFMAGLFGYTHPTRHRTLPPTDSPTLPKLLPSPISGLSFYCRSSTSLTTLTLSPVSSENNSWEKKPMGLGISTSSKQHCSFLSARPSLASILSATKLDAQMQVSSPLEPLPVHLTPPKPLTQYQNRLDEAELRYLRKEPMHTHIQGRCGPAIRLMQPVPPLSSALTLTAANLSASRSHASLKSTSSSLYSRDVSGEGKRLTGQDNLGTSVKSPLATTTCADQSFDQHETVLYQSQNVYRVEDDEPKRREAPHPEPRIYVRPLVVRKTKSLDV